MNIMILAFRVSGLDGVSLEISHWKEILEKMGHKVTLMAGELDRGGLLLPELHFKWPHVYQIHERVVSKADSFEDVERGVFTIAGKIEGKLREVLRRNGQIDVLIVANVFSLPMHFPLAVALARIIEEYSIPTIAKHYDFWWERQRYLKSNLFKFFEKWFPPKLSQIKHVVINSIAQAELKRRFDISADIISDTFDFASGNYMKDSYSNHFRGDFKISEDEIVFLQPTRIVRRKRIELSIEFIKALGDSQAVLVVAQNEGDEELGYQKQLSELVKKANIKCRFIGDRVGFSRKIQGGRRIYNLWDCYLNADFVTYPTELEGFGNQFVETMYFKKPIILTPYAVFVADIAPLGFETVVLPHAVTTEAVDQVKQLIKDKAIYQEMVEKNFLLAKSHFSYEIVEKKIEKLFNEMNLV